MKQYHEINFVRSVLILLVILVHIVYFGELYPAVKAGILGFMMPSFLVVTGYLVNIEKTFKEFSLYLFRIFVPYLIMVVGFSVLSAFLPVRDGIAEITVSVLLEKVFVSSIGPYWFLYVMMGCGICYYLSFKILPMGKHVAVRLIAFAGLLYLASLVVPLMTVKIVMYYFAGAALRQLKLEYSSVFFPTVLGGFCLFALLFLTNNRDWGSIFVVLTVISFLAFSNWVYRFLSPRLSDYADWIGMNTLPIYLFHPIFTMVGKFYLPFFAWDSTGICFTILTLLLAVCGSLLIAWLLDKTNLSNVFGRKKFFRAVR